jgi:hypothetical protein
MRVVDAQGHESKYHGIIKNISKYNFVGNKNLKIVFFDCDWFEPNHGDERLVPDLLRGRGRSIGGDLDVGEEGSEQTIVTLQSLHHGSVCYQHVWTRVGLTKKAQFL